MNSINSLLPTAIAFQNTNKLQMKFNITSAVHTTLFSLTVGYWLLVLVWVKLDGLWPHIGAPGPPWSPCDKCACDVSTLGHCDQASVRGNYTRIYSSPAHSTDYNSCKNEKYIEWCGPAVKEAGSVKLK